MSKIAIYQIFTRLFGNKNTNNKFNGSLEENGVGKFSDISTKALKEIKKLGMSHVWYTGVIEHATQTDYTTYGIHKDHPSVVKGKAGSPYAIKDYYDVNPDLANVVPNRMKEFEALVKRTHKQGLKVIIDFVPNHVARFYYSDAKPKEVTDFGEHDDPTMQFSPNNNFYYIPDQALELNGMTVKNIAAYQEYPAKATGNDVFHNRPSEFDWYETVKLNYGVDYLADGSQYFNPIPKTWHMMLDVLLYWSKKGVDGFRCDMAEMVPLAFWEWVIPTIKAAYPSMIFIAEIYNPARYREFIYAGQFDYLYDKVELYDSLRAITEHNASVDAITQCWRSQEGLETHMLRFLENHDEQRVASNKFAIDAFAALPAMVVTATLNKGPVMIYFGQEVGESAEGESGFSGDDGRTSIFDYCGVPEHQKWMNNGKFDGGKLEKWQIRLREKYSNILTLCKDYPAVYAGEFYDLQYLNLNSPHYPSDKVYAYFRHSGQQKLLFVINFDKSTEFRIHLKLSKHVYETVGLHQYTPLIGIDIFCKTGIKFNLTPQETVTKGIPMRLLPSQALVFEIQ
ncbi:MAG: alpha-amylase family protein [Flammeovirgaceae bacterium]